MDSNILEMEILSKLKEMKKQKKYIALSLHPPYGDSVIQKENNRMFINEGRDGKWENISEHFYDKMVTLYDSRN